MKYNPNKLVLILFFVCLVAALAISLKEANEKNPKLTINERLDNLEQEFNLLDQRLDRMEAKIDQRFEQLEGKLDQLILEKDNANNL
jgi:predicted nuclease with TOPRIM domain